MPLGAGVFADGGVTTEALPLMFLALKNAKSGEVEARVTCAKAGGATKAHELKYKAALGMLKVRVVEARNLKSMDLMGKSDPFVQVQHGMFASRTPTVWNNNNPAWNSEIRTWVYPDTKDYRLQLIVYDDDESESKTKKAQKGQVIGRAVLAVGHLTEPATPSSVDAWLALESGAKALTDMDQSRMITQEAREAAGLAGKTEAPAPDAPAVHVEVTFIAKADMEATFFEQLVAHFDKDGDAKLDRIEVGAMMDLLGTDMSQEAQDKFFDSVDKDGSGVLEKGEILGMFNSAEFQSNAMSYSLLTYLLDGKEGMEKMSTGIFDPVSMTKQAGVTVASVDTGSGAEVDDMGLIVMDRASGLLLHEHIPSYIKMALKSMYRSGLGKKLAETKKVRSMLVAQSRNEGHHMDDPKSKAKIPGFIALHQLNTEELKVKVEEYEHFNAFFYRELKAGARPVAEPDNGAVAVSPADSRMTVFPELMDATHVWIKGSEFTVENLLTPKLADVAPRFKNATLVIARLAPQDYHRFHFPVSGTIKRITELNDGTLYTVNPIAVRQPVNVYTENVRHIIEIETEEFGLVVMIAVGATMVGSVNILPQYKVPGARVKKGDDGGYFAFGGSTTLLLFKNGSITLDEDLVNMSKKPIEVLLRVGNRIGVATGNK